MAHSYLDNTGEIKLKTRTDLTKKEFFNTKDNKYRVKKLIKLNDLLKEPNFDIELDEMKFTKLKKYKEYPLVKVTKSELQKILANYDIREASYLSFLGIKSLEKDSYSIQLDIYLDKFIRINLKEIRLEENLQVIFNMFDKDNNGLINKNEALELISFFHETNSLCFDNETLIKIVDAIFKQIDKSNTGNMTKQALGKYLEKYKDEDITINPFTKIKTSDAVTKRRRVETQKLSEEEEKVLERINRKKDRSKIKKFWVLNKKMIIWSMIYIALCLFSGFFNRRLEGGRQYSTTKDARFFAGIIFINLALLVIYMCDAPLTYISSTVLKFYLPLGDPKHYHAVCASVLGLAVIPHIFIHLFGDFRQIAAICARKPEKSYVTVAWLTFANLTGITGVFATIIFMALIIIPLIKPWLKIKYELFLHSHKLFYLALIVLFLHCNTPDTKRWPFIYFMSFPLLLFIIELIIRLVRFFMFKTNIVKVQYLNSGVILLEIKKPKHFSFRCGQYAQLNIPKIEKWQWHPFTIASSPNDDNIFFYINPVGDWTSGLKSLSNTSKLIIFIIKCFNHSTF